jgi:hypothetical protein
MRAGVEDLSAALPSRFRVHEQLLTSFQEWEGEECSDGFLGLCPEGRRLFKMVRKAPRNVTELGSNCGQLPQKSCGSALSSFGVRSGQGRVLVQAQELRVQRRLRGSKIFRGSNGYLGAAMKRKLLRPKDAGGSMIRMDIRPPEKVV